MQGIMGAIKSVKWLERNAVDVKDKECNRELLTGLRSAVCFDIKFDGEWEQRFQGMPITLQPPYPVCWYELGHAMHAGEDTGVLVAQQTPNGAIDEHTTLMLTFFGRNPHIGMNFAPAGLYAKLSMRYGEPNARISHIQMPNAQYELTKAQATEYANHISSWFMLANCAIMHPKTEIITAPKQKPKLKKNGKKPKKKFYRYRTLNIDPFKRYLAAQKAAPTGRTHASPCIHTRRGHYRTLRSGKVVWVRHSVIGDKRNGLVVKDYVVKPKHQPEV